MGDQTTATDPTAGTTTYTYDLTGNLTFSTDARGQTLGYTYDALNRKTGEYSGSTSGPQLASWVYDTVQPGKLSYSTRFTPQGNFLVGVGHYDGAGNPNSVSVQVPSSITGLAGTYTTEYGYTSTNLLHFIQPPNGGALQGEEIANSYDSLGNQTGSAGANVYLGSATYTPFNEPAQYNLGTLNSVATLTYNRDPQTRRVNDVTFTGLNANAQIDDTSYNYDPSGNLVRTTDVQGTAGSPTQTQCDNYDPLDRLAAAWTATDSCANPPSTAAGSANIGGTNPFWESWTIDPTGLRTIQVQHALPGATGGDTTTTYTYPPAGTNQTDTLSSTSTTGPSGTSTTSYGYDPNGNTTTRDLPAGNQTLTWDADNHLATDTTPTGTTTYTYDADGNQLLVQDPTSTTLYLPGEELTYSSTTKTVTGTRYYTVNGQVIAERVGESDPVYVDGDQHGTMQTVYNPDTQSVTRRQYDPYGNQIGNTTNTTATGTTSPGVWPDHHGFLNDPTDPATGLTDIGVRQYDPATGRFLSLDPHLNPSEPQSLNGYAYADNDPVSDSDPTGLCPVDRCGFGVVNNGRVANYGPIDPGNPNAGYVSPNEPNAGSFPIGRQPTRLPTIRHTPSRPLQTKVGPFHLTATSAADLWAAYDKVMQTDWPYPQVDWGCQDGINGDTAVAEECGLAKADLLRVLGLKLCDQPGITCGDHGSGIGAIIGPFGAMALGGGHGDGVLGSTGDNEVPEFTTEREMQMGRTLSNAARTKGFFGMGSATEEEAMTMESPGLAPGLRSQAMGKRWSAKMDSGSSGLRRTSRIFLMSTAAQDIRRILSGGTLRKVDGRPTVTLISRICHEGIGPILHQPGRRSRSVLAR